MFRHQPFYRWNSKRGCAVVRSSAEDDEDEAHHPNLYWAPRGLLETRGVKLTEVVMTTVIYTDGQFTVTNEAGDSAVFTGMGERMVGTPAARADGWFMEYTLFRFNPGGSLEHAYLMRVYDSTDHQRLEEEEGEGSSVQVDLVSLPASCHPGMVPCAMNLIADRVWTANAIIHLCATGDVIKRILEMAGAMANPPTHDLLSMN